MKGRVKQKPRFFFGRMETDHFSITIKNLAIVPFFKKNGSIRILAEYIAVLRI